MKKWKTIHKRKRLGAWVLENPEKLKQDFIDKDVIRQNLNIAILALLKQQHLSGFEIIKIINNASGVLLSSGTIYPLLQSFEEDGLITKITSNGKSIRYKVINSKKVDKILNNHIEAFKTLENLMRSAMNK